MTPTVLRKRWRPSAACGGAGSILRQMCTVGYHVTLLFHHGGHSNTNEGPQASEGILV